MNGTFLRPVFIFLVAVALLDASSFAQQAASDASFVAPKPKKTKIESNPIENPAPYDINGVVAQAFKMKHPLQLMNPLAPRKYGDGHDNVTWDPDNPEKPKGIILFGLQW